MFLDTWSAAAQAQIAGSAVRPGIFLYLAMATPMLLWGGVGDMDLPEDLVLMSAMKAQGMGELVDIPPVQQLVNGLAERIDFTLSGVSANILALASGDAPEVRGSPCSLGFMVFGSSTDTVGAWQPLSPVSWMWDGVCDVVKGATGPVDEQGDRVRSVSLSVGSLFTARKRSSIAYWTDAEQRKRSPDDSFCDHVAALNSGVTKRFKPRS
jgi:hypothetical protein